jgi:hypothetical protein
MQLILVALGLMLFPTEDMREFSRSSNGNPEYAFVVSGCTSGLRNSGYSVPLLNGVFLKQVNHDGTVDKPVCHDSIE